MFILFWDDLGFTWIYETRCGCNVKFEKKRVRMWRTTLLCLALCVWIGGKRAAGFLMAWKYWRCNWKTPFLNFLFVWLRGSWKSLFFLFLYFIDNWGISEVSVFAFSFCLSKAFLFSYCCCLYTYQCTWIIYPFGIH